MGMTYNDYRQEITFLDMQIKTVTNEEEKLVLIDKNIALNKDYIRALRRPLRAKKFWCVFLSILFCGMGLLIFLPQIITRNAKADACERRITYLMTLKSTLTK